MVVTEAALQRNMKSYLAWHHRQWVLQRARSHLPLPREFRLLDRLFLADERNFHAWVSADPCSSRVVWHIMRGCRLPRRLLAVCLFEHRRGIADSSASLPGSLRRRSCSTQSR